MQLKVTTDAYVSDDQSWLASKRGVDEGENVVLDLSTFSAGQIATGHIPSGWPLAQITATGRFGAYANNLEEVEVVTIFGSPSGGTFILTSPTFGSTSDPIPYNATADQVLAALRGTGYYPPLKSSIKVTGNPGGPWTITKDAIGGFGPDFTGYDFAQYTATSSLTGGTSPSVSIVTTQNSGYTATDGRQFLIGHLLTGVKVRTGLATVMATMLDVGKIRRAKLPAPVDAVGIANVRGRLRYI